MQRRSDAGYRQFESTPSTHPEGAYAPSSQASAYPPFQPPSSAMLAAPAHQQSFPDPAAPRLAHSAARPTLPPLSQFTTRAGSQYGSAYDVLSTSQSPGAHHAPPHDYRAPPGYQSFPPANAHPGRPNPVPLHYGEPGAHPYTDPILSPASRESPQNPLKRRYESVQDRPYGGGPYPAYLQPTDPGESSAVLSAASVSSPSTSTTPGYPTVGTGPLSSADPYADVLGSAATRCVLHLRQQPRAARAGPDGKDRRPIDPPPVLQLMMTDFNPESQADIDELQAQFVVHCRLVSATSPRRDVSTLTSLGENGSREIQRLLLGTSVSSPFHTKDDPDPENVPHHPSSTIRTSRAPSPSSRFFGTGMGSESAQNPHLGSGANLPGTFFIFADLSVRKAGEYRLEFSLMKMDAHFLSVGEKLPIVHKIASQPFRVVNAKDFDQVQPSTPLVRGLIERGAGFPLKLKKGTREGGRRRGTRGDDDSGSEEDEGG